MKPQRVIAFSAVCALIVAALLVTSHPMPGHANDPDAARTPIYNPYPPGILPSDLDSEIARVSREVDVIEGRALARWHALAPPILTGQPPVLQNSGTESIKHSAS